MGFMYSIFNTSIPKQAPYLRCSYLALLSFHPFIMVIGKGAKNLPIYKKFFRIFRQYVSQHSYLFWAVLCRLKPVYILFQEQQALPVS